MPRHIYTIAPLPNRSTTNEEGVTMRNSKPLWIFSAALVFGLATALAYGEGDPAPDAMTGIDVGEKAPDFTLKDQNGEEHSLSGLLSGDDTVALMFFRSANW